MPLHDATEYQFATPTRRVLVREAHAPSAGVDLSEAGRQYAEHLETFLDATDLTVTPEVPTAGGAEAVTVTATVPRVDVAGSSAASVVRTALLRFGTGPVVELTVYADTADAGAEAEFRRLLDSARPAATADPIAGVARAIAAGPPGRPDYPAGAVRLALTPDYHGPTAFTLVSADDAVRYRLEAAAPAQAATKSAAVGTILSAGVGVAATEDGRPVRYEAGPRPRLSPGRRPAAPEASVVAPALCGAPSIPAAAGEVLEGVVCGTPVQVRVSVRGGTAPPADLAEQMLRTLNESR